MTDPSSAGRLVIIGAGGHAKVVAEAVLAAGLGDIAGFVDPAPPAARILGFPVLGDDECLPDLHRRGIVAAVVALGGNGLRLRIGERLRALGFALPPVVHPSALVSPSARLGDGVVVMARAVVGTESVVETLAIVNTAASLDHDNVIGAGAHVAPGCALAGSITVGARTLIGVGSAVRPGIRIGCDVVVGAGSTVVSDIADGVTVMGTPARPRTGRAS